MLWPRLLCVVGILSTHSALATFWNWLITNPHEVDLENLGLRLDSPLPPISGGNDDDKPLLSSHPKDASRSRQLTSLSSDASDDSLKSNIRSTEITKVTCQADRECPQGLYCDFHYALCKLYKGDQDPCRSDSQCAIGFDCMFGRCTKAAQPGHKGARCKSNQSCLPGLCCARQHGEKICKQKLKLGRSCFVPDGGLSYWLNELCPCEDGLVCAISSQNNKARAGVDWLDIWNEQSMLRCIRPE